MTTQYARANYTEIYDLHTEVGKPLVMGVHTPTNISPRLMLNGFFGQFKRFRYVGCDMVFQPIATMESDPLQVSISAGEGTIDPRDLANPIIHCGFSGEHMADVMNKIFNVANTNSGYFNENLLSIDWSQNTDNAQVNDALIQSYYQMLSDPTFKKSGIQQGFMKTGMYPLTYTLATSAQIAPYSTYDYVGGSAPESYSITRPATNTFNTTYQSFPNTAGNGTSTQSAQLFTNGKQRLDWLDCDTILTVGNVGAGNQTYLPKLYMYLVMLPPAYKTEMYFRVILTHHFEFEQFRSYPALGTLPENFLHVVDGLEGASATAQAEALAQVMAVQTLDVVNGEASQVTQGVS